MKLLTHHYRASGITKTDVIIILSVIGVCGLMVIAILAGLLVPALGKAKAKAMRINCVSNLKQVGLAYRMWANDHTNFPMVVASKDGGSLDFLANGDVASHFKVMKDELNSPKVLVCPTDRARQRASTWEEVTGNENISYFVGLEADETKPQTILSGDRNIIGGKSGGSGKTLLSPNDISWGKDLHVHAGNVGLGDGSAMQLTDQSLRKQLMADQMSRNANAIPIVLPETKK